MIPILIQCENGHLQEIASVFGNFYNANAVKSALSGVVSFWDLPDCKTAKVKNQLNSNYELQISYPVIGENFSRLQNGYLIATKATQSGNVQLFRIYNQSRKISGIITVNAQHISYDMNGNYVKAFEISNVSNLASSITSHLVASHPFVLSSDFSNEGEYKITSPSGVRATLFNGAKAFGGEVLFDNFNASVVSRIGSDGGVVFRYGDNLISATQTDNNASVYTHVFPYYHESSESGDIDVYAPDTLVSTGVIAGYTRIYPLDLSNKFSDRPTSAQVKTKADEYIAKAELGIPKISADVSYVDFGKTMEFPNRGSYAINLGDDVTVNANAHGIQMKARVTQVIYDVLKDRIEKITIGTQEKNLSNIISDVKKMTAQVSSDLGYTDSGSSGGGGSGGGISVTAYAVFG